MAEREGFSWRNRRRVIWATLAFCGAVIGYALVWSSDGAVAETAISMAFMTGGAVVGSYCFGAAWENRK